MRLGLALFSHARMGNFIATSPPILGHEVAGTIEETGQGITCFAVDDRVAVKAPPAVAATVRAA
jgi:D-arabinose 1-dehydrogenase-like Zn-dependent alcohol dehydrogenase